MAFNIFKILIGFKKRKKFNSNNDVFQFGIDCFGISINKSRKKIKWDEISEINVFKRDLITIDRVEMEIICKDQSYLFTEDMPGWLNFIQHVKNNFPEIPQDWDTEIIQPPFETNFRTIYTKQ